MSAAIATDRPSLSVEERTEQERMILDAVERFLVRDVAPYAHELEALDIWPEEIVCKMAELGLFGATIGEKWGGLGLTASTYTRIVERVSRVWMSISGIFNSHLIMAAAVERSGTEAQKPWLPRFASGELRGGIALTEPDAGTDLQAIRLRADKTEGGYRLNGTKIWISNAYHGHILAVLAKTDPEARPRHKGMSLFLVEKGDGFTVTKKLEKLGYKGIDSAGFTLDDYFVPEANLVGNVEGRGMQQALGGLELGRINVAARGVGIARACLEESVQYSQIRKTFGKPIAEHQAIQLTLADMATQVEAARLLTEQAAAAYDRGERCDMEAGMAKLFATEAALHNSLEAMRLHGAYGYAKEYNIERYYRDAPLLAIAEGTNEMQRLIIAKQLIQRNPA